MKKILALILMLALTFNSAFAEWNTTLPGSTNISDIDARVTENYAAAQQTLGGLTGWKNLSVSYASAASITVTADMLYLQTATLLAYRATSVSETITITTAGASGLVSSLSEASSTWYYVWIARKSSDGTTNGYLSTATDLTTFLTQVDSGYDQAALVSAVRNDGSSNFVDFRQNGSQYWYTSWLLVATGTATAWTAVDVTSVVPSSLSNIVFGSQTNWTGVGGMSNDSTAPSSLYERNMVGGDSYSVQQRPWSLNIITANTVYYYSTSGTGRCYVAGFDINKL